MDKYLYRGEIDQQLKLSVTHRMWGPLASSAIHWKQLFVKRWELQMRCGPLELS